MLDPIQHELDQIKNLTPSSRDDPGDFRGISPTQLRNIDLERNNKIQVLENQLKEKKELVKYLVSKINTLNDELRKYDAVTLKFRNGSSKTFIELRNEIIAMGETPWITTAKKGNSNI